MTREKRATGRYVRPWGALEGLDTYANVRYTEDTMQNDGEQHDWTTAALAQAGGLSTARIRQILIAGRLRGRKAGRDWLVAEADARAWLAQREARRLAKLAKEP